MEGSSYLGAIGQTYGWFAILAKMINDIGPESFSQQALYETAISFSMAFDGCEEWNFTDGKRDNWNHLGIYEFSANEGTLIRVDSEWQVVIS